MPQYEEEIIINPTAREEISDLIGNPPSWLLRSGISMIALVVASILTLCFFIKYPDKISAVGIMTSETPPIEIISKANGYIEELLIADKEQVEAWQELIRIQNTADSEDIIILKKWIEEYSGREDIRSYVLLEVPENLQLGVIQQDYASLVLKYHELQQTLQDDLVFKQIKTLSEEIKKINILSHSQKREKSIYKDELHLQKKGYLRNESLANNGVISQQDFERAKTSLLQKERQYEGMENTIIQNTIRVDQLELEKLTLQGDRRNILKAYQFQIAEIISRLKNTINSWSESYILNTPISGEISIANDVKENKFIKQGQIIAYVLPQENNSNYISIKAPILNIGKLEIGQRIILKFDAFPYKEFGIVETQVNEIAKLPQIVGGSESYYEIKSVLPDTIFTDFNVQIPYKPNMTVYAEIITEDKSIIQRIFNQFLSIIKHS